MNVFSSDPMINIYPEDHILDGMATRNSQCGSLELTYETDPSTTVQYVNFVYNGDWIMKT